MFRPSWTPASLQNLNKNFAFFAEELIVVPPPPLTAAYLRDRASVQLPLARSLPPAPVVSTLPPRPILCQTALTDAWRGQNLVKPYAFFSDEIVVIPGPALNAAFYRDIRQVQIILPKALPPAPPDAPLPRVPVARAQIDTNWQRGWSLVQRNIAVLAAGSIAPVAVGSIPNVGEPYNTGTHTVDLSVYFTGATSYSISPSVGAGWSFNAGTGVITIDTSVANTFGPYTVTATNAFGSTPSNAFSVSVSQSSGVGANKVYIRIGLSF